MSRTIEFIRTELSNIEYWRIETWTLMVAIVALMQPWFIAFYKRVLRSGKVEIYETGTTEIGYSSFGPTISLYGTLRARDRELFIRSAQVQVVRMKDQSRRHFNWFLFRPLTTIVGRVINELEVESPAGFMLPPSQPRRYNIMFSDPVLLEQIQLILKDIQDRWIGALTTSGKLNRLRGKTADPLQQQKLLAQLAYDTYPDFALKPEIAAAVESIRALSNWEAGTYQVTLMINTAKPTRTYKKSWLLVLTADDEDNLRLNAEKIVQGLCTELNIPHNVAYPKYTPDNLITRALLKKDNPSKRPDLALKQ